MNGVEPTDLILLDCKAGVRGGGVVTQLTVTTIAGIETGKGSNFTLLMMAD